MEYIEFRKRGHDQSGVWLHFLRSIDHKSAKCKKCHKILKSEGGSTSSLRSHLKSVHGIPGESGEGTSSTSARQATENQDLQSSAKKRQIDHYFVSEQSMDWTVARMVCLDGIPFKVFANSVDLRRLFKNSGHQLPSSANTIRNMVFQRSEAAKHEITQEFDKLKTMGLKLSISMDEWTSNVNKRYINVNVHSPSISNVKSFHNIGLIRITGSATATRCAQLLNDRLEEFHLNIDDIVSLSTDGASVMVKMGRSLAVYHQLCYAHGLQLAILDVLYKNQPVIYEENLESDTGTVSEEASDIDSDSENEESFTIEIRRRRVPITNLNCKNIINKVRKVCKLFRKSPKNDEALQKYVKQTFNKEINLLLDCRTRWSSLAVMLERFIMLFPFVQKALIDINSQITLNATELELMKEIHSILDIFKVSLELLCENDASLLTADFVLRFIMTKLKEIPGNLSAAFQTTLKKRISERYQVIQSVLKYLDNPSDFYNDSEADDLFVRPSTDDIASIILALLTKMGNDNTEDVTMSDQQPSTSTGSMLAGSVSVRSDAEDSFVALGTVATDLEMTEPILSTSKPSIKVILREELQKKLAASSQRDKDLQSQQKGLCSNVIRFEMALHENGGNRGRYLEMAHKLLMSIKPTSVECERTFSTAGYLCSKFRSRMNDRTLNSLIVLKHYLLCKKK